MPTNAINRRKLCANCKYAAMLAEPFETPRGYIYGYCYKYGHAQPIGGRGMCCSSYVHSDSKALTAKETAAMICHILHLYDGWGEARLRRLFRRLREELKEMEKSDSIIKPYAAEDVVKTYQRIIEEEKV